VIGHGDHGVGRLDHDPDPLGDGQGQLAADLGHVDPALVLDDGEVGHGYIVGPDARRCPDAARRSAYSR
jgi:hypothetical protein